MTTTNNKGAPTMARKSNTPQDGLTKKTFEPLTENQSIAQAAWKNNKHLMLIGSAGSGKTYIGLNFAIEELDKKGSGVRKIVIIRSSVSVRDVGFMPGNAKEKARHYEAPYISVVNQTFGRGDAYDVMKGKNKIDFSLTSFLRGTTFDDCVILVDEVQNMSFQELNTIITRIGVNSRIIFCGDTKQDDLTSERFKETSGLRQFISIINRLNEFETVQFTTDDIVRSDLVKNYIIAKELVELGQAT